jgi:RNA polymerase sigma factor (sigma-70 family)
MTDTDPTLASLQEARRQFAILVAAVRPDLHRYCARMTGSVIDGEDVVQDTLARAFYELSGLKEPPAMRGWLFRIAHNRALDSLRRYERRMTEPLAEQLDEHAAEGVEPDEKLMRNEAIEVAMARFLELPSTQRSCVILKDVLDSPLTEIAELLDISVLAVKAALHRGRSRLRALSLASPEALVAQPPTPAVQKYAELFNARDWDAVRAMLVDDVRLDVVGATKKVGREKVGVYFTNYAGRPNWHMVPAWLDGTEGLAVVAHAGDLQVLHFIALESEAGAISAIQDFYHVPYFTAHAQIRFAAV